MSGGTGTGGNYIERKKSESKTSGSNAGWGLLVAGIIYFSGAVLTNEHYRQQYSEYLNSFYVQKGDLTGQVSEIEKTIENTKPKKEKDSLEEQKRTLRTKIDNLERELTKARNDEFNKNGKPFIISLGSWVSYGVSQFSN